MHRTVLQFHSNKKTRTMKSCRILLALTAIVCYYTGYSKAKIDGVYYDTAGLKLVVCQKKFIIIDEKRGNSSPVVFADYFWVDDNFIKLRNGHFFKALKKNMVIKKTRTQSCGDSISVGFKFKDSGEYEFEVTVWCDLGYRVHSGSSFKYYSFIYSHNDETNRVIVPQKIRSLGIYVSPKSVKPLSVDSLTGYYSGFKTYSINHIHIGKKLDSIDIELRGLDEFFGRQYVDGDYVRVVDDKLYWRGRVFEKSYAPEDIRYIEEKESALRK